MYDARQRFPVTSDMRSQLCRKLWAQLIPPDLRQFWCPSSSLVRRRGNFPHYGSLDSSIFQRFLGTAEIARFLRISISAGYSARLRSVRHKTSFFPS